jgi:DNA-binding NarL/FixJ family response regulator
MKLGFIDDEPAFIMTFRGWFKDAYNIEIFEIEETTTANDLAKNVKESNLDMLIVDFKLDDNGNDFLDGNLVVNEVRKLLPKLPMIILTSNEEDAVDHIDDGILLRSKDELNPENISVFKKKILNTIKSYKKTIQEKKNIIKELSEKKIDEDLSTDEEELLFSSYSYLNDIYPDDKTFKDYLTRPSEINGLVDLLKESNKLINSLTS